MTLKVNKHSQALERAGMPADKNKFVSTLRDHLRTAILLVALPALQACDDFYAAGLALNSITEYKACVQECLRHKYAFDAAVDMSSLSEDEGLPPVPDLGIEETQKACVAACTPDNDLPDGGIPFADLGSDQSPAHADASLDASFDAGLDGSVDEGFDVGVDEGFDVGVDEGPDEGFDDGVDEGFDDGVDEGFDVDIDAGMPVADMEIMELADADIDAGMPVVDMEIMELADADIDAGMPVADMDIMELADAEIDAGMPVADMDIMELADAEIDAGLDDGVDVDAGLDEGIMLPDTDNDGIPDAVDNCIAEANPMQRDTDGDLEGDVCDFDDDNDRVHDEDDAFPLNPHESVDTDGDGTGNNADTDDDNDGFSDADELGLCGTDPLDAMDVPADFDGDTFCDALDTDDDNDGFSDADELGLCNTNPLDAMDVPADFDEDTTCDALDTDDDNDGVLDENDICAGTNNVAEVEISNNGCCVAPFMSSERLERIGLDWQAFLSVSVATPIASRHILDPNIQYAFPNHCTTSRYGVLNLINVYAVASGFQNQACQWDTAYVMIMLGHHDNVNKFGLIYNPRTQVMEFLSVLDRSELNNLGFTFHSSSQSPVVYNLSNPNLQIPGCGSVDPAEIIGLDQALTRIFEE